MKLIRTETTTITREDWAKQVAAGETDLGYADFTSANEERPDIVVQMSFDEAKFIWHRINCAEARFEEAYQGYSDYNELKDTLGAKGRGKFTMFCELDDLLTIASGGKA